MTCPDLPEVTTFGEDEADARLRAADAIVTALQGRINARQEIPAVSFVDGIEIAMPALIEAKLELYRTFLKTGLTKAELARRLGWHAPSVDRLLDLNHDSRIGQIDVAAKAMGRDLHISMRPAA